MEVTGVIGGSGLYELEGFEVTERKAVETPFGSPSDELVIGELEGRKVAFLPATGGATGSAPARCPTGRTSTRSRASASPG